MGKWAQLFDDGDPGMNSKNENNGPEPAPDGGYFRSLNSFRGGGSPRGQGEASSLDLPADWQEGVARLLSMPCPPNVPAPRWAELLDVTRKLIDSPWLYKAAALGWDALDLWGYGIRAPAARIDLQGLVWLLKGRHITAMSATTCSLRVGDAPQTFYRRRAFSGEVTLAWRLGTPDAERGVFDPDDFASFPDQSL